MMALSSQDLIDITGVKSPRVQARVLDHMKVHYTLVNGRPSVLLADLYLAFGVKVEPPPAHIPIHSRPLRNPKLLSIKELQSLPPVPQRFSHCEDMPGMYCLWDGDRLLYIGESGNVPRRVYYDHVKDKSFSRATWMRIDGITNYRRRQMEAVHVCRYEPPLNETRLG